MSHDPETDRKSFLPTRWLIAPLISICLIGGSAFAASDAAMPEMRIVRGLDEPLIATAVTGADEDAALSNAIAAFRNPATAPADFADSAVPLMEFLAAHPSSAWRMALLTDIGLGYYRSGYFTKASKAWEQAWNAGRNAAEPRAKALADRAFGELVRMHARLGHAEALEALMAAAGERPISGPATEMVTGAREGLWMFRNDWGTAYLCGPMALKSLLTALKADPAVIAMMDKERSGQHGYSLEQVGQLADRAGLAHHLIHRAPGEPIPVPSVVNWRLNHYAAITEQVNGRYHIHDPTFGSGDLWMTKAAIDEEASGFFLVPESTPQSASWRAATADEAKSIYGMGFTAQSQPGATTPCDSKSDASNGGVTRMCMASATSMVVSLSLSDTPVGYTPAFGPSVQMRLTYNQREADQPAVFSFFNVGPKWTLNALSWVQDYPAFPGYQVLRYVAGGGAIDYSSSYAYDAGTGAFSPERQSQAILVRVPATGPATGYELRNPDGSKQVFALSDGAATYPRRFFLTTIVDPAGNSLALKYDGQLRLTTITDATGRNTTLSYGVPTSPLLVTRMTDPFGRHADLTYDALGRLSSITDVIGITSSFSYDASGLVNAMTTPYGTSQFAYGSSNNNGRFLGITDPLGYTERVEFSHSVPLPFSDPVAPPGSDNIYLYFRNTFFWDKHAYAVARGDYTKARITHWLHNPLGQTSPIIESTKAPLENRVWNRYPGQSTTIFEGSTGTPISVARVLDDGTTQAETFTYNAIGKPTTAVDPAGRRTVFTYADNNIDLLAVQQQTNASGALSTIAAFTYNAQHLPLTYTDAAGQTTHYAYNAAGQLISTTNALNQITSYTYDALGRPIRIVNANGLTQATYTYDAFDRIAVSTDSEGYSLAYSYDALDRVTQIRYPDGTTTQYGYNRLDRVSSKDRLNRSTSYAYDANRRLTATTDPLGQTTRYGYYENGTLASMADPKGNITRWDVDVQSRPTAKHYANGNTEGYAYETSTSRLKSRVDAMGQVKTIAYTVDDRPSMLAYTSASRPTPTVTFTYDAFFPRVTTMKDGIGTSTWAYKPVGAPGALKLAIEDGPYSNDAIAYQYDALGRVTVRTVDTAAETFAYDRLGRVVQHTSVLGNFALTYLGQTGQVTGQGNGVVGTTWAYDSNINDRRLASIANRGQARSFAFSTDSQSRINGIRESIGATLQRNWSFGYDGADRLVSAQASTGLFSSYTYDAADNLANINGAPAAYNAANQLVNLRGAAYTYDANGNLIEDGTRRYQWDAEDRLVGIVSKAQVGVSSALRYDGFGRRLIIADTNSLGTAQTRHLWCGDALCQARTAGDQVTRRYFEEGVVIPQGGMLLYYSSDQLGSVHDLLTSQSGINVATFDYDAYGNATKSTGRISSDFRYAGLYFHGQSGLSFANRRVYDSASARWISRDPGSEWMSLNLYTYADGLPISNTDRSGLYVGWDDAIAGGIGAAIGITGQIIHDVGAGSISGWQSYVGAAFGGAVGGETLLYTGNPYLAGAAGGAGQNIATQLLQLASGSRMCFSVSSLAADTSIGAATGLIPGAGKLLPGKGGGNWLSVSKQIMTKFGNGTISTITPTTAGKVLAGQLAEGFPGAGAGVAATDFLGLPDKCQCEK